MKLDREFEPEEWISIGVSDAYLRTMLEMDRSLPTAKNPGIVIGSPALVATCGFEKHKPISVFLGRGPNFGWMAMQPIKSEGQDNGMVVWNLADKDGALWFAAKKLNPQNLSSVPVQKLYGGFVCGRVLVRLPVELWDNSRMAPGGKL